MTGTLAQTIQGEAGSDPAAQFAVASAIYNRARAGTFPGGSDPFAIVNAPSQFTGYAATPSASADALAQAIETNVLPMIGDTGNATFFQSGAAALRSGLTAGINIGGNFFSDQFGAPSANFSPPSLAHGTMMAAGPIDTSSALHAGANAAGSLLQSASDVAQSAAMAAIDAFIPGGSIITSVLGAGAGQPVTVGLQPQTATLFGSWLSDVENAVGGAFDDALGAAVSGVKTWFEALQNWFTRGGLIALGLILVFIALYAMLARPPAAAAAT